MFPGTRKSGGLPDPAVIAHDRAVTDPSVVHCGFGALPGDPEAGDVLDAQGVGGHEEDAVLQDDRRREDLGDNREGGGATVIFPLSCAGLSARSGSVRCGLD
jgi:hypothetical protein